MICKRIRGDDVPTLFRPLAASKNPTGVSNSSSLIQHDSSSNVVTAALPRINPSHRLGGPSGNCTDTYGQLSKILSAGNDVPRRMVGNTTLSRRFLQPSIKCEPMNLRAGHVLVPSSKMWLESDVQFASAFSPVLCVTFSAEGSAGREVQPDMNSSPMCDTAQPGPIETSTNFEHWKRKLLLTAVNGPTSSKRTSSEQDDKKLELIVTSLLSPSEESDAAGETNRNTTDCTVLWERKSEPMGKQADAGTPTSISVCMLLYIMKPLFTAVSLSVSRKVSVLMPCCRTMKFSGTVVLSVAFTTQSPRPQWLSMKLFWSGRKICLGAPL
eukprot:PhM_4_TR18940/c0_g1_i1/m.61568